LALGNWFITLAILSNTAKDCSWKVDLPVLNKIVLPYSFNCLMCSSLTSGHPLLDAGPATSGHSSSLSKTPSPSVSGQGQPLFSFGPASSGHSSCASAIPSPSVSGHPLNSFNPGSSGQASSWLGIPSPSESGQPFIAASPNSNGH